jgi:hypothetical protein
LGLVTGCNDTESSGQLATGRSLEDVIDLD